MALPMSLPENAKIVELFNPKTTNASLTSDTISLKNALKAWAVFNFTQAAGHATTPTLRQATDVANGTTAAGPTCRIWVNEDTAATDTLVAATAGASVAVTNDIKNKMVVFEIDPASLTEGYDCVYFTIATSSQATNFVTATMYIEPRYQQATPPTAITD
ncbi:MAG: hypothetical protein RJA55_600 [Acidobacteriota bacterium]